MADFDEHSFCTTAFLGSVAIGGVLAASAMSGIARSREIAIQRMEAKEQMRRERGVAVRRLAEAYQADHRADQDLRAVATALGLDAG